VSAGAIASFGVAPAVAVGVRGALDARLSRFFSLGIDLRGDLPASGESVETYVLAGSVVACARAPVRPVSLLGCGLVSLGDFHETGVGVANPMSGDALYASVGPRAGVELPLGDRFFLIAHADAAFVLLRNVVKLDGGQVFQLPVAAPSVGLGGGALF
jgi:hypothetical protein